MTRHAICLLACLGFAGPALAQYEDWSVWETDFEAGLGLVAAPDADEPVLFRLYAGGSVDRVFDNGLEAGLAGRVEMQKDHPGRAGFTGVPAGFEGAGPGVTGAYSGLATGAMQEDDELRIQLEQAYLYLEGGYGQVRAGRDEGVAARFQQVPPSVFRATRLGDPQLDPTGQAIIRTDHDLTGPAEKISLTSQRIVGFRAGLSYTPSADVPGLDRDPQGAIANLAPVALDEAVEAAASFSHLFREAGVRVRAATGYSTARASGPVTAPQAWDRVETWSGGLTLEKDKLTLGASVLASNNGGVGDYEAFTLGVTRGWQGFVLGADYGHATDDAAGLEGDSWSLGIGRDVTKTLYMSLGYKGQSTTYTGEELLQNGQNDQDSDGIVIEITLSR